MTDHPKPDSDLWPRLLETATTNTNKIANTVARQRAGGEDRMKAAAATYQVLADLYDDDNDEVRPLLMATAAVALLSDERLFHRNGHTLALHDHMSWPEQHATTERFINGLVDLAVTTEDARMPRADMAATLAKALNDTGYDDLKLVIIAASAIALLSEQAIDQHSAAAEPPSSTVIGSSAP